VHLAFERLDPSRGHLMAVPRFNVGNAAVIRRVKGVPVVECFFDRCRDFVFIASGILASCIPLRL
jgi:hypothetical protein